MVLDLQLNDKLFTADYHEVRIAPDPQCVPLPRFAMCESIYGAGADAATGCGFISPIRFFNLMM